MTTTDRDARPMTAKEIAQADQDSADYAEWKRLRRIDLSDTTEKIGDGLVRFLEAEPHTDDPPDTVRYVVIQPDGRRQPRRGRVKGEGRGVVALTVPGVPPPPPESESGSPYPRGPLNGG